MARITVRDLTRKDWPVVEALFGKQGACGGCWCMHWRVPIGGKHWEEIKGAKNKRAFKQLVTGGEVHGCLAFAGDEAVGWVTLGPREDFVRMERSRVLPKEWEAGTWCVPCFYVPKAFEGRGVGVRLLKAAVDYARRKKARRLEGYPIVPPKAGRYPSAFSHTGVPAMFARAGFRDVTPRGAQRPVWRRDFRRSIGKRRP